MLPSENSESASVSGPRTLTHVLFYFPVGKDIEQIFENDYFILDPQSNRGRHSCSPVSEVSLDDVLF